MESIIKAVQRARDTAPLPVLPESLAERLGVGGRTFGREEGLSSAALVIESKELDVAHLRRNRIVAYDAEHATTRHYDLLRNQLNHQHPKSGTVIVAVAGLTQGCGTSVTAINLAFSFARNRAQQVVLLDANFEQPSVNNYLGLPDQEGLKQIEPLAGEFVTAVRAASVPLRIASFANREHDGAQALLRQARAMRDQPPTVVVIDLPPLLSTDAGLSYVASSTCVAVVLAAGETTLAEVESCKSLLGRREGVLYVLNKAERHGL